MKTPRPALASKLLLIAPLLIASASSQAAIRLVSTSGSDSEDCSATPCQTIAYAIDQAQVGEQLLISRGQYILGSGLIINKSLRLTGVGQDQVIINGRSIDSSVITISPEVTASISGLSIINGSGNIRDLTRVGGGIDNQGNLTLTHVLIRDNEVKGDSSTRLEGGTYSPLGGGIYSGPGTILNLEYSTIDNNVVTSQRPAVGSGGGGGALGGGIAAQGSALTINYSTISNNQAKAARSAGGGGGAVGGGIYIADLDGPGTLTLSNSTLSNNSATGGSISLIRSIFGSGGAGAGGDCGRSCSLRTGISESNGEDAKGIAGGGGGASFEIELGLGIFDRTGETGGQGQFLGGGGGGGARSSGNDDSTGTGGNGGFGAGGAAAGWAIPDTNDLQKLFFSSILNPEDPATVPELLNSFLGAEKPVVGTQGIAGYGAGNGYPINDVFSGSGAGAGIGAAVFANVQSEVTITNSTISQNTAKGGRGNIDGQGKGQGIGGALFNNGAALFRLQNLALIGNQADAQSTCALADGSGLSSEGGNYEAGADSITDTLDCDQLNLDVRTVSLASLRDNGGPTLTHRPDTEQSLDNALTIDCTDTDQRQIERLAPCDSGAVELTANNVDRARPSVQLNRVLLDYSANSEVLLFPTATVNDPDSEDFNTLTVSIVDNFNADQDRLSLNLDSSPEWLRAVSGNHTWLLHNNIVIAEILTEENGKIRLQFNRLDTSALVSSLLNKITYSNTENEPSPELRNINVRLTDAKRNIDSADMAIAITSMPEAVVLDIRTEVLNGIRISVAITDFIALPEGELLSSIDLLSAPLLADSQIETDVNAGTITYTAGINTSGQDQITYTVNGSSNEATLFVTVLATPPQAEDDSFQLELTAGLDDIEIDVLGNDTLARGEFDLESITIVSNTKGGELNLTDSPGKITYKLNDQSQIGEDTFSYQVSNSDGLVSNVATVTLALSAPEISTTPDSATVDSGQTISLDILDNDSPGIANWDLDTLEVINAPSNGSVTLSADNLGINYSSNSGFVGDDTFQYQVTNTLGQISAATTVSVKVLANPATPDAQTAPEAPVAVDTSAPAQSSSSGGGGSLSYGLLLLLAGLGVKTAKRRLALKISNS